MLMKKGEGRRLGRVPAFREGRRKQDRGLRAVESKVRERAARGGPRTEGCCSVQEEAQAGREFGQVQPSDL